MVEKNTIDRAEYLLEQFGRVADKPVSESLTLKEKEETMLGLLGNIVDAAENCASENGVGLAVKFIERTAKISAAHDDCRRVRNAAVHAAVTFGVDMGIHAV